MNGVCGRTWMRGVESAEIRQRFQGGCRQWVSQVLGMEGVRMPLGCEVMALW